MRQGEVGFVIRRLLDSAVAQSGSRNAPGEGTTHAKLYFNDCTPSVKQRRVKTSFIFCSKHKHRHATSMETSSWSKKYHLLKLLTNPMLNNT